jgi:hypothetical protein
MGTCSVLLDGRVIAKKVGIAGSFVRRLIGLQWRRDLPDDEGLLIKPCNRVHSFNMKFPIDLVFVDDKGTVVELIPSFRPGQVSPKVSGTAGVLELSAGTADRVGLRREDRLTFDRQT